MNKDYNRRAQPVARKEAKLLKNIMVCVTALFYYFISADGMGDNNQWWASSCTSSASKNARYASAPATGPSCAGETSVASARVGSVAS